MNAPIPEDKTHCSSLKTAISLILTIIGLSGLFTLINHSFFQKGSTPYPNQNSLLDSAPTSNENFISPSGNFSQQAPHIPWEIIPPASPTEHPLPEGLPAPEFYALTVKIHQQLNKRSPQRSLTGYTVKLPSLKGDLFFSYIPPVFPSINGFWISTSPIPPLWEKDFHQTKTPLYSSGIPLGVAYNASLINYIPRPQKKSSTTKSDDFELACFSQWLTLKTNTYYRPATPQEIKQAQQNNPSLNPSAFLLTHPLLLPEASTIHNHWYMSQTSSPL